MGRKAGEDERRTGDMGEDAKTGDVKTREPRETLLTRTNDTKKFQNSDSID